MSVSESFINDDECYGCDNLTKPWSEEAVRLMWQKAHNSELEYMSNADCIQAYAEMLQTKRRNVLLVASDDNFPPANESIFGGRVYAINVVPASKASITQEAARVYNWICSGLDKYDKYDNCLNSIGEVSSAPAAWKVKSPNMTTVEGYGGSGPDLMENGTTPLFPVDYCLSERADPHCKLQFVPAIAILVTMLNLFKAGLILFVAFSATDEEPLLTMGDAVASFLEQEDPTTRNMCLLTLHDVKNSRHYFRVGPREWTNEKRRWKDVTSRRRRITTTLM
jgi:hypothetical protein